MDSRLPPDLFQAAFSAAVTWLLAMIGRIAFHVQEVRHGRRRFLSWHLVWELFTALAMGLVAEGLASYLDITGKPATGLVVVVSYLGPRAIEALWERLQDKVTGPKS